MSDASTTRAQFYVNLKKECGIKQRKAFFECTTHLSNTNRAKGSTKSLAQK